MVVKEGSSKIRVFTTPDGRRVARSQKQVAEAYGPPVTWKQLKEKVRELRGLEAFARSVVDEGGEYFCANEHWYGYEGKPSIKEALCRVVGWEGKASDPVARTQRAYDIAYDTLYKLLPDCRGACPCIQLEAAVMGIPPAQYLRYQEALAGGPEQARQDWDRMQRHVAPLIKERDGYQCVLCRSPNDLTVDHIVPLDPEPGFPAGTNSYFNLRTLCRSCNSAKGNR